MKLLFLCLLFGFISNTIADDHGDENDCGYVEYSWGWVIAINLCTSYWSAKDGYSSTMTTCGGANYNNDSLIITKYYGSEDCSDNYQSSYTQTVADNDYLETIHCGDMDATGCAVFQRSYSFNYSGTETLSDSDDTEDLEYCDDLDSAYEWSDFPVLLDTCVSSDPYTIKYTCDYDGIPKMNLYTTGSCSGTPATQFYWDEDDRECECVPEGGGSDSGEDRGNCETTIFYPGVCQNYSKPSTTPSPTGM